MTPLPAAFLYGTFLCPACGLRFPAKLADVPRRCPLCRRVIEDTRERWGTAGLPRPFGGERLPLRVVTDSLRSLHNVGAIFRSADALGVERVHLCGITGHPPAAGIRKVALGAEDSVPWSHHPCSLLVVAELKSQGFTAIALEALEVAPEAIPLASLPPMARAALVVGNELTGLAPSLVAACHLAVYLPQRGLKSSMNVSVAAGIALYRLAELVTLEQGGAARE